MLWLSIAILCLCVISSVSYFYYSLIYKKDYKNNSKLSVKLLLFHIGFALTILLFGIAILNYYPYNTLSFLAIITAVLCVYIGLVLGYYFKTRKQAKIIFSIITYILVALTIWKLICFTELSFVQRLPGNVCNILIIFCVICLFKRVKTLEQYIVIFGLVAGIINILIGGFYNDNPTGAVLDTVSQLGYYHYRFLEATYLHNIFFTLAIYCYITKYIKIDWKKSLLNMVWIVPLFIIYSFLNQVWQTDYFFTGTKGITPQFLIDIYNSMPGIFKIGNLEVNILHSLFLLTTVTIIIFLISFGLEKLQKNIKNKLIDQPIVEE